MPRGIGRRGIASRAAVGQRQIAARYGQANALAPYSFYPGTYTWTPAKGGYWKFVLWGPGDQGSGPSNAPGGGSGAYVEYTRWLSANETVSITVGAAGGHIGFIGDTVVTFASGYTITAGRAHVDVGGAATGGDVNINGSNGGAAGLNGSPGGGTGGGTGGAGASTLGGGAGAPANLPFRGGNGSGINGIYPQGPGAGGGGAGSSNVSLGADGLALVFFVRD